MPDPAAVAAMFGRIAGRYDLANHLLSAGLDFGWRRRLVHEVARSRPAVVVDLATGSGDVAFALRRRLPTAVQITGIDFCRPMLDQAERKRRADPRLAAVSFALGDALDLPIAAASVDAVTIAFGLRNTADRARALREMHRVLRPPAGRLFVLEFSQPWRWFAPAWFFYLRHILPPLAARLTGDKAAYDYLGDSIAAFPGRAAIAAEIRSAGFTDVRAIPLALGTVALHIARAHPNER
jgi:demethylmenaquinone methyltransferase/2-methoxy-6-polyprenyl-1,4-benzoquinol methylase